MCITLLSTLMTFRNNIITDPLTQPVIKYKVLTYKLIRKTFLFCLISIFYNATIQLKNIFERLPEKPLSNELVETLLVGGHFRLERIVSTGQVTPEGQWYDQAQDEWVMLLKGAASILFEDDRKINLQSGDYLLIKAHQKHRVSWTDPNDFNVWLTLHAQPE